MSDPRKTINEQATNAKADSGARTQASGRSQSSGTASIGSTQQAEGFGLETQTEESLAADAKAAEQAQAKKAEDDAAAEAKDKADRERDDFDLTGSDLPADANTNQGDLLNSEDDSSFSRKEPAPAAFGGIEAVKGVVADFIAADPSAMGDIFNVVAGEASLPDSIKKAIKAGKPSGQVGVIFNG